VNAILLLMGLLVLSYIGSFLVGGRAIRGAGLPSGIEYVALGFVVGPEALGLIGRGMIEAFEPIALVALGWLTFSIGLDFGRTGLRRVRRGAMALGLVAALGTLAIIGGAVWLALGRVASALSPRERVLLAGGIAAAGTETTRHAIRWVIQRFMARGPLTSLLDDFAHTDDAIPLVALAALFSLEPTHQVPFHVPLGGWIAITVGLGILLGGITALHIGREFRLHQTWGVLLGTSLLGVGIAARLELATLSVMFFMGVSTAALSKHRSQLRTMVTPTERPVLLPAMMLAGARLDFHATSGLAWIAGIALAARIAAKLLVGGVLRFVPAARSAGPLFGLGLLSSGSLAMGVGLACAMRFPGVIGDNVLIAAAVITVFGEFVGPLSMRAALRVAGEIQDKPPSVPEAITP
jgi:hypothetical protein